MSLRKIVVGLVAAAALVTMSGCSGETGGTAAQIDGQAVISQSWVDQAAQIVNDVVGRSQAASGQPVDLASLDATGFVLQNAIAERVLTQALATYGVTITDEQRDSALSQAGVSQGSVEYDLWSNPVTRDCMRANLDITIANQAISAGAVDGQQLVAALGQIPVTVNPRYGDWSWDTSQMGVASRLTSQPGGILATPQTFTLD